MANPSVVQGDATTAGVSNQNIARQPDGFALDPHNVVQTQQYMRQLQQLQQMAPVAGELSSSAYFPGANRSIQVGGTSTQTLGSQPIFAAGTGLAPFEILQNWRRTKAQQEAIMHQPQEFESFMPEITELSNMYTQPAFNEMILQDTQRFLDEYASRFDGDYMMAQKALKNDREFQSRMKRYDYIAKAYNQTYDVAVDILDKMQSPGEHYVSPEVQEKAKKFVRGMRSMEDMNVESLARTVREFDHFASLYKVSEMITENAGTWITQDLEEHSEWTTNKRKVIEDFKRTGFEDEFIEDLIDSGLRMSGRDVTEQERKDISNLVRSQLDSQIERSLTQIVQDLEEQSAQARAAGLRTNPETGEVLYTQVRSNFLTNEHGNLATGDKALPYPTHWKDANGYKAEVVLRGQPNREFTILDKTGKPVTVSTSTPFEIHPTVEYNALHDLGAMSDPYAERAERGVMRRKIEGTAFFSSQEIVETDETTGRQTPLQVVAYDRQGNEYPIGRNTHIIVDWDDYSHQLQAMNPAWHDAGEAAKPESAYETYTRATPSRISPASRAGKPTRESEGRSEPPKGAIPDPPMDMPTRARGTRRSPIDAASHFGDKVNSVTPEDLKELSGQFITVEGDLYRVNDNGGLEYIQ